MFLPQWNKNKLFLKKNLNWYMLILLSYWCCNTLLQIWWPKTTHIYYLIVYGAQKSELGLTRLEFTGLLIFLSEDSKGESVWPFPSSGDHPHLSLCNSLSSSKLAMASEIFFHISPLWLFCFLLPHLKMFVITLETLNNLEWSILRTVG